jgi:hypothetical protein
MEIVFVHFGSTLPKYLIRNLNRTCVLFPETTVTLITDVELDTRVNHSNFQKHQFEFGLDYQVVDKQVSHPKSFRNNFWFTSLARLMALCDYVIEKQIAILHIESDVLISKDLPLSKFANCDRSVAYTMVGQMSGVASVLWLRSASAAEHLKNYIKFRAQTDPMTTDMKILGQYQGDYPKQVRILASFPTKLSDTYLFVPDQIVQDMVYSEELFGGYFDAADAGQYLLGDDPRNNRGVKFLRRELGTSFFKPRKVTFWYSRERHFLNIASEGVNRFFSLHIHSKNESVFDSKRLESLLSRAVNNQSRPESHVLVPSVFIASVINSLVRRYREKTEFKK